MLKKTMVKRARWQIEKEIDKVDEVWRKKYRELTDEGRRKSQSA